MYVHTCMHIYVPRTLCHALGLIYVEKTLSYGTELPIGLGRSETPSVLMVRIKGNSVASGIQIVKSGPLLFAR